MIIEPEVGRGTPRCQAAAPMREWAYSLAGMTEPMRRVHGEPPESRPGCGFDHPSVSCCPAVFIGSSNGAITVATQACSSRPVGRAAGRNLMIKLGTCSVLSALLSLIFVSAPHAQQISPQLAQKAPE